MPIAHAIVSKAYDELSLLIFMHDEVNATGFGMLSEMTILALIPIPEDTTDELNETITKLPHLTIS